MHHWLEAWNAHDVDAVLEHFADAVTFTSPVAARIVAGSDGIIRGKQALRAHRSEGVGLIPDLHFELVGVYERLSAARAAAATDGDLVAAAATGGDRVTAARPTRGQARFGVWATTSARFGPMITTARCPAVS